MERSDSEVDMKISILRTLARYWKICDICKEGRLEYILADPCLKIEVLRDAIIFRMKKICVYKFMIEFVFTQLRKLIRNEDT